MILRWCNSISGMKHIRHERRVHVFDLQDLRLALERFLSRGCERWLGPWVADFTIRSMISSAVSFPQLEASSLAADKSAVWPTKETEDTVYRCIHFFFKRIYSWNTSEDEFVCIYLGWLGCVCADQGEQRRRCRRPAGWYKVLQSSVHVQLRPPCSPNPAAETLGHLKERLQTSHSEKKEGQLISGSAWEI